jgi:hypothetical protein
MISIETRSPPPIPREPGQASVAGVSCSVESQLVSLATNFHGEVETIDSKGVCEVIGIDVADTKGERSLRFSRIGDELDSGRGLEVGAQSSALDQLCGGEVVVTVRGDVAYV